MTDAELEHQMPEAIEFSITMAYDAFRICLGRKPKYHTPAEIIRWIKLMSNPEKQ